MLVLETTTTVQFFTMTAIERHVIQLDQHIDAAATTTLQVLRPLHLKFVYPIPGPAHRCVRGRKGPLHLVAVQELAVVVKEIAVVVLVVV